MSDVRLWEVERLDGPSGKAIDRCVVEGDTREAALNDAMAKDDRKGRLHYRIKELARQFAAHGPGEEFEFERDG